MVYHFLVLYSLSKGNSGYEIIHRPLLHGTQPLNSGLLYEIVFQILRYFQSNEKSYAARLHHRQGLVQFICLKQPQPTSCKLDSISSVMAATSSEASFGSHEK